MILHLSSEILFNSFLFIFYYFFSLKFLNLFLVVLEFGNSYLRYSKLLWFTPVGTDGDVQYKISEFQRLTQKQ